MLIISINAIVDISAITAHQSHLALPVLRAFFEVTMVGIAVTGCGRSEFGLVVDLVPCDDVLATGSDRSTDREDQSAFKRNLQQSQYTATKTIIRKITHTGEAHGVIRLTRIWMFVTL